MNPKTLAHPESMSAQKLYEKLKRVKVGSSVCNYTLKKCEEFVPLINEINELKKEKNAVILAHTYVTPEILYGVADFIGDSYKLSKDALSTDAKIIIFSAVRFMGETAKILNPEKEVYIPGMDDGCTLADSINAQDVRELRRRFPGYTFVSYINTSVAVKAECDVCVTSGNINQVVENIPNDKIYFLPDQLMGLNLISDLKKKGINKDIKYFHGTCVVHEEFNDEEISRIRLEHPDVKVIAHPECKPEICALADFVGSTAQMLNYMQTTKNHKFLVLTECGLSSRFQVEFPEKQIVGSCRLCRYMKSNTLEDILRALKAPTERDRITIEETMRKQAFRCVQAMFHYTEKPPTQS